jgi:hypothetical protein
MELAMLIVLNQWRIKPDKKAIQAFLKFWRTVATIADRTALIAEFLSEAGTTRDFPYITWYFDPDALGDHKSYITLGIWQDERAFHEQLGKNFDDEGKLLWFEKYRRRRIILTPDSWRLGGAPLPLKDYPAGII